jgi:hypothetical protein
MPFGKHKGWPLVDVPDDYLAWLLSLGHLREPLRSAVESERVRRATREHVDPRLVEDVISAGRRALARRHHPDVGGSHELMLALDAACSWLFARAAELRGVAA